MGSWDEDDTIAPEVFCDWMRASATPFLNEKPLFIKSVAHNTFRDPHKKSSIDYGNFYKLINYSKYIIR